MALRTFYLGSVGPLYYDDADVYHGGAIGMKGIHTDGPIYADRVRSATAPVIGVDTLRLDDLAGIGALSWTITDATASRNFGVEYLNGTAYDMMVIAVIELEV